MFERFTDNARRAIVLAQDESRLLQHDYIGTEHLLLGLLREGTTVAGTALASLHISLEDARRQVREMVGEGEAPPAAHIPFTPRAKKVLELSLRETLERGQLHVGTEHLLLGLIREGNGAAIAVLRELGAGVDKTREAVLHAIADREGRASAPPPAVRLRPMRQDEWNAWRALAVSEYAEHMQRSKGLTREQALVQAEEENDALLTDGLGTPGHYLFVAEDAASGVRVGHLWFGPRSRNPDPTIAWLYDIFVEKADRGRGIGRAMMELLEVEARSAGKRRIELNVFGDNAPAKRLYDATGYAEMARQLGKDLS